MTSKKTALALLLLGTLGALQAQHAIDCGTIGKKACTYRDWEYYNIGWGYKKCDLDLKEKDGYCVDDKRYTYLPEPGWLGWAMKEQMYGISRHQPINRIPLFAAHNSFSNYAQGFTNIVYANHGRSITSQLNMGVRHIELDPHRYAVNAGAGGEGAVRVCHSGSSAACLVPGYGSRLFGMLLIEIRNWLRANPHEILVIKLDEKNIDYYTDSGYDEMYSDIGRHLGPYLYPPPANPTRWPTPFEIRSAGKQVVIAQHDSQVRSAGASMVWNAYGFVQESNWPKNQDFDTCTSYDGLTALTRPAYAWWDVAEGRSFSNSSTISDQTGLLTDNVLRKAVNCGAGILGLDFLQSLYLAPVGYTEAPDTRSRQFIWSFAENDFGYNGPAALNLSTGRWNSTPSSDLKPFACAKIRDRGEPFDIRGWKITAARQSWNRAIGNSVCFAEFGKDYEFAAPANGFQNAQLRQLALDSGLTGSLWLNYSTEPGGIVAVSQPEVVFTVTPGGSMPSPQPLNFYGMIGSQASAEVTVPWLRAGGLTTPIAIPQASYVPVTMSLEDTAVRALQPGVYTTKVTFRSTLTPVDGIVVSIPITVDVTLIIKQTLTFPVSAETSSVPYDRRVRISADFPLTSPKATGTTTFVRVNDPNPTATAIQVITTAGSHYAEFNGLPPGTHRFAAAYSGDDYFQPASSSNEVEVVVLPRIGVSPASLSFTINAGDSASPSQTLTISNASTGLAATRPCGWLSATVASSTQIQVALIGSQVHSLAPGTHSCDVTVSDSQSATLGSTIIPVTLNVRTTLSVTPSTLELLTGGDAIAREVFVDTATRQTVDLTATSNVSWLSALIPSSQTAPKNVIITANPQQMSPGSYTGRITFRSTSATSPVYLDVTMLVVRPTVVDAAPSGLSVLVDNKPVLTPASFIWTPGSTHQISASTILPSDLSSGMRYRFASWQHGGSQTQSITAKSTGANYIANYSPEYLLSTDVVPSGSGTIAILPSSVDGFYPANANIQLSAGPAAGKYFTNWSGSVTSAQSAITISMTGPTSAIANFANAAAVNYPVASPVATSVTVNGTSYPVPGSIPLVPGLTYTLSAPTEVAGGTTGTRWLFTSWAGLSNAATFSYTAPLTQGASLTLAYQQQFLVTTTASPSSGGTITGGGWINAGAPSTLQATPATGFTFSGFSGGGLTSSSGNPATIASVTAPLAIVANFAATGNPLLSAATSGARTDGPGAGQRTVPIVIRNSGTGPAVDASITGVVNILVTSGSGVVTTATVTPLALGTIAAGGQAATNLVFNWPSTATRVQFTVRFASNNGAYSGSTTITLFR